MQVPGRLDGRLLIVLVVYTVKEEAHEEIYEIISARKASASERQRIDFSDSPETTGLAWLKSQGGGHLTRINEILREKMLSERKR